MNTIWCANLIDAFGLGNRFEQFGYLLCKLNEFYHIKSVDVTFEVRVVTKVRMLNMSTHVTPAITMNRQQHANTSAE